MDINALRVFDVIHSLGITEEEFADLEEEQKTDHTGLYIRCIKNGNAICVSHDENHSIIIRKIGGNIPAPSRILFKTLVTFDHLPDEIYTLHGIAQYKMLDTSIKHRAENMEELKDLICDRFVDKYPKELGSYYDTYNGYDEERQSSYANLRSTLVDRQLKALFWLFNEDHQSLQKDIKTARPNIARIIKVFERNNRRLAVIYRADDYDKRRGGGMGGFWFDRVKETNIMIRTFTPRNPQYNYVDLNREIFLPRDPDDSMEIWLGDDLFEKVDTPELQVLSRRLTSGENGEGWMLLTADEFNRKQGVLRIEMLSETRRKQEQDAKDALIKRIDRSFAKGKVTRHGITFAKDYIECEGIMVKNRQIGDFIMQNHVHLQVEPEFSKIVKDFIAYILQINAVWYQWSMKTTYECTFEGKETLQIGSVKVRIEKRNKNIYINDRRIPKNDLAEVLFRALRHTDQKSFDELLERSSRINLALQSALETGGITFQLKIDRTTDNPFTEDDTKMVLSLPLKRVGSKNFTSIGGQDFQIQDTNALMDIGKEISEVRIHYNDSGYLKRTIRLLYKAIKGITPKDIALIIQNGQKEYEILKERQEQENAEKVQRADEFVTRAVELTKAKKIKNGFLVTGKSGKQYTVHADTLAVYDTQEGPAKEGGRYVCLVDMETDTDTPWGKKDALAKRLLMLAHDIKVARDVDTLKLEEGL